MPVTDRDEEGLVSLFGELGARGRDYVRAEIDYYRTLASYRAGKAKKGIAAIVVAALLGNAAIVTLLIGFMAGLAAHTGPVLAASIVALVAVGIAFLLVRYGADRLQTLSGDADEEEALREGERRV
ncbi:MAG: phage holin family protein [Sphingomonadaceae bacterium]